MAPVTRHFSCPALVLHQAHVYTWIMDETQGTTYVTTARLDRDVRLKLEAYAERERRTVSSAVNHLLDQILTNLDEVQ